ncbi:MAG: hypothetical protein J5J00_07510 [Deltaproteobacteria bacterium]|nr:hypothetical protein [Deltaproteobacteria bacterium]
MRSQPISSRSVSLDCSLNGREIAVSDALSLEAGASPPSETDSTFSLLTFPKAAADAWRKVESQYSLYRRKQDEVARIRRLSSEDIWLLPAERNGSGKYITSEAREADRRIYRKDAFAKYAPPFVLDGSSDAIIIGYGGIVTSNYSQRRLMVETNRLFGRRVELYSLYGNDGTRDSLLKTTNEDIISFLEERAEAARALSSSSRPKIIFFGYSTGALAGAILEARRPGTFDSMVLTGMPLFLRSHRDKVLLKAGNFADRALESASEGASRWAEWLQESGAPGGKVAASLCRLLGEKASGYLSALHSITVGSRAGSGIHDFKELRKVPYLKESTVKNYVAFERLRDEAREALLKGDVECPYLANWGADDELVNVDKSHNALAKALSQRVTGEVQKAAIVPDSPHAAFFGPGGKVYREQAWSFISERLASGV